MSSHLRRHNGNWPSRVLERRFVSSSFRALKEAEQWIASVLEMEVKGKNVERMRPSDAALAKARASAVLQLHAMESSHLAAADKEAALRNSEDEELVMDMVSFSLADRHQGVNMPGNAAR